MAYKYQEEMDTLFGAEALHAETYRGFINRGGASVVEFIEGLAPDHAESYVYFSEKFPSFATLRSDLYHSALRHHISDPEREDAKAVEEQKILFGNSVAYLELLAQSPVIPILKERSEFSHGVHRQVKGWELIGLVDFDRIYIADIIYEIETKLLPSILSPDTAKKVFARQLRPKQRESWG